MTGNCCKCRRTVLSRGLWLDSLDYVLGYRVQRNGAQACIVDCGASRCLARSWLVELATVVLLRKIGNE